MPGSIRVCQAQFGNLEPQALPVDVLEKQVLRGIDAEFTYIEYKGGGGSIEAFDP
jgi:hypothetical protein